MRFTGDNYRDACLAWQSYITWLKVPDDSSACSYETKHENMRRALKMLKLITKRQRLQNISDDFHTMVANRNLEE